MKKKEHVLELEIRRLIYNFILKHPGVYLRQISRQLQIPKTTLDYHLRYLNKNNLISDKKDGEYLRYFADEKIGVYEKKVLNIIRKKTYLHIILFLSMYHKSSRQEIAKDLDKSPSTIYSCLKKLLELDIIQDFRDKKIVKYKLKNEKDIDKVLIKYKNSLLDKWVVFFFDYLDWIYSNKHILIFLAKYNEKKILQLIEDIFPNPYHG